jgi:hypothetical protein
MIPYFLVLSFGVVGALIVVISFFVLPTDDALRRRDHRARTMVSIGIAVASISVAIGVYYLKEQSDLEHERRTASLNFFKSMLQFGVSAKHMEYIKDYCNGIYFSKEACQENGALAARFSSSLPSVDFTFSQVARGARTFATSSRLAIYLIEGEVSLKGRMPITIDTNIQKITAASRPSVKLMDQLRDLSDTFQAKADEMSAIYCMFAESTSRSWAEFDELIKQLDGALGAVADSDDQLRLMRLQAKDLQVANVDCANVRGAIDDVLPVGGGGGGG